MVNRVHSPRGNTMSNTNSSGRSWFKLAGFLAKQQSIAERRLARLKAAAWRTMGNHPEAESWSDEQRAARVLEWVAEALAWREQKAAERALPR